MFTRNKAIWPVFLGGLTKQFMFSGCWSKHARFGGSCSTRGPVLGRNETRQPVFNGGHQTKHLVLVGYEAKSPVFGGGSTRGWLFLGHKASCTAVDGGGKRQPVNARREKSLPVFVDGKVGPCKNNTYTTSLIYYTLVTIHSPQLLHIITQWLHIPEKCKNIIIYSHVKFKTKVKAVALIYRSHCLEHAHNQTIHIFPLPADYGNASISCLANAVLDCTGSIKYFSSQV